MRKFLFFGTALLAAYSLPSCNKEEVKDVNVPMVETKITFALTPDAGVGIKAGRPLASEENLQEVTDMKIYVFKEQGPDYTGIKVTDGSQSDHTFLDVKWEKGTSKKVYTVSPKLAVGKYKFLAVGLDNGKDCYNALDFTGKKLEEALLTLNTAPAAEAFAGLCEAPVEVKDEAGTPSGIQVRIALKRAVAGVLLHVKNVPAYNGDVKSVAVALYEDQSTSVNLSSKAGSGTLAGSRTICEVKIPDGATVKDGLYEWAAAGAFAANCIGCGAFVLPKAAPLTGITLAIELRDATGQVLKTFKVKDSVRGQSGVASEQYALIANNLYNLGTKKKGGEPTEPGPGVEDPDKPADLSKGQDVQLVVDPNWESLHDMEIDY